MLLIPGGDQSTVENKDSNRAMYSPRAATEGINQRLKHYAILGHV